MHQLRYWNELTGERWTSYSTAVRAGKNLEADAGCITAIVEYRLCVADNQFYRSDAAKRKCTQDFFIKACF
jgi:hypothetical protein